MIMGMYAIWASMRSSCIGLSKTSIPNLIFLLVVEILTITLLGFWSIMPSQTQNIQDKASPNPF